MGTPRRWTLPLIAGILAVAGSWPYLSTLGLQPMTSDAAVWIARGAPVDDDWARWTLRSSHFAGYRPVAALSYTANYVLGGFAPFGYRAVNIVLHALVGCLVFVVYRKLVREGPGWGAWIAAGFFMAHPLAERVVPYLARRSYALSAVFALAAVAVLWGKRPRPWLGAGLLGLALLSNETAFATAGVVVLVALSRSNWRAAIPPAIVTVTVFCARTWVLEGLGGYQTAEQLRGGALTAKTYTALLGGPWWLGVLALAYYAWRAIDSYRRGETLWRTIAVLAVWIFALACVSLVSGTWFYRQLYPSLIPLALLVAATFACGPPGRYVVAHRAFQVALVSGILVTSPVIRGPDAERMAVWTAQDRLLNELRASVGSVSEPARVLLVLSYPRSRRGKVTGAPQRITDLPAIWTEARMPGRDVAVRGFVFYERAPARSRLRPVLEEDSGRMSLTLPAGLRHQLGSGGRVDVRDVPTTLPLESKRNLYVYIEADGRGELLHVP